MPTQQRRWRDHESVSAPVRKKSSERSDERTIGRPKPRTRMLTSQNRELVPQQHQFHVFGELGSTTANEQPQNSSERKVSKGEEHRAILPGPANALTADSSCAVQRFLVFARARETPLMPETTSGAATEHPIRSTPSRIHREDAKAVRHSRIQARASNRSFDTLQACKSAAHGALCLRSIDRQPQSSAEVSVSRPNMGGSLLDLLRAGRTARWDSRCVVRESLCWSSVAALLVADATLRSR